MKTLRLSVLSTKSSLNCPIFTENQELRILIAKIALIAEKVVDNQFSFEKLFSIWHSNNRCDMKKPNKCHM